MKILFVLPVNMLTYGYSLDDFINTHFAVHIAREVARRGNTTELHVFWDKSFVRKEDNITIHFHATSLRRVFKHNFAQFSFSLLALKAKSDVVHFHEPNRLFFMLFRVMHPRKSIIAEHHGTGIRNPFDKSHVLYLIYGLLRRFVLPKMIGSCRAYIVHNERAARDGQHYAQPDKILVSHNGITHEHLQIYNRATARQLLGIQNETVFLFVGRINRHKGIPELIEAFETLAGKNTKLILAGPLGDSELEEAIRPYWVGFKKGGELQQLYSAADVFCLPTRFESFGLVLIEALANNLPLIVSDIPELREVAPAQNALFVEVGDRASLGTAMQKMLDDQTRKAMSLGGREYVLQSFTWEKICEKYIELYEKSK